MGLSDGLIRFSREDMENLSRLEGQLIDYGKEIARAREAGLGDDLKLDERENKRVEMRQKIKKMKEVYKPVL